MTVKQNRARRVLFSLTLGLGVAVGGFSYHHLRAEPAQVAAAESLKSKALEAVKAGKFDLTNDYLSQAAAVSKDPTLEKMAAWTKQFEAQRQVFVTERHKEYEKAAREVKLLEEKHKPTYAMEIAARAYSLSDDKEGFRKEAWVSSLVENAKKLADQYEKKEDWVKSLRLYSQLSVIEPEMAEWKDRLKTSTRRVRLLALYTPDELKKIQEGDAKERDEVEAMLRPTTQPATKPAVAADEDNDNANKIKWRETLSGIKLDMLEEAVRNARVNYYRDVSYQKMILGGLSGLRVVLTTPALQHAFPGLANADQRAKYLGTVDAKIAQAEKDKNMSDEEAIKIIDDLAAENRDSINLPDVVFTSEFADGAFGVLDPFSNIIWPSEWEEFNKQTKGEFSGVGIQIHQNELGQLQVVTPIEDTPAMKAGIRPDYIITHINHVSAKGLTLNEAVKKITGPPNTHVILTVKKTDGNSQDYDLVRQTIQVASVKGWIHRPGGGWDYMIDPENKVGYFRLTNFSKTTPTDVRKALDEMKAQDVRGIIFDLRYDPGGLLNAATDVVDRFIPRGKLIVSTRPDRPDSPNNGAPPLLSHDDSDDVGADVPLIVLVNQYSASASEIVSGALKDHQRAMIVGERTFGKGSVQMLYPLSGQQAVLKLTTSHYYLPNGTCIHREENSTKWGVEPDVTVEMTPEQMRAAIDARQEFDVLRDATQAAPAHGAQLPEKTEKVEKAVDKTKEMKDPLQVDPQLSAALLLMRLQLAGGTKLF
jgi:carboxyl-terminal processing protease